MTTTGPVLEPRDRDGAAWAAAGLLAVAAVAAPLGLAAGTGGLRGLTDAGLTLPVVALGAVVLLGLALLVRRGRDRLPGALLSAVPPLAVVGAGVLRLGAGEAGDALRVVAVVAVALAALHLRPALAWVTLALAVVADVVVVGTGHGAWAVTLVLAALGAVLVLLGVRAADRLESAHARLDLLVGVGRPEPADAVEDAGRPVAPDEPPVVADLAALAALAGPFEDAPGRASWGTGFVVAEIELLPELVDAHGEPVRDALLRHTARVLRDSVRPGDVVARVRGEELVVLFPGVGEAAVHDRAESLRRAVRDTPMPWGDGLLHATVAVGAAHVPPGPADLGALHAAAGEALQRSRDTDGATPASA